MTRRSILLVTAIVSTLGVPILASDDDAAASAVKEYQRITLLWIDTLGTTQEKDAYERMKQQRLKVIQQGPAALKHLVPVLKHKQVNVRRGTAIAMLGILDQHKVKDRKLLDNVLRRMIDDADIKVRSNLYHVANELIDNLAKTEMRPQANASPDKEG